MIHRRMAESGPVGEPALGDAQQPQVGPQCVAIAQGHGVAHAFLLENGRAERYSICLMYELSSVTPVDAGNRTASVCKPLGAGHQIPR
jgi:hypothetical protein